MSFSADMLVIQPRVREALDGGRPVVAFDSTVIAHEIPAPANLETALAVERIIEEAGAVPATIAILDGAIRVGLDEPALHFLATGKGIRKAGERDLPMLVVRHLNSTATVSAGMAIAAAVGIRVLVTSGIGGVGPDASHDFDISADLPALAAHRCLVVCSGAKAFMDIAGTLEVLETLRVPIVGYQTGYFPLFYSPGEAHRLEWTAETPEAVAAAFAAKLALGAPGGMLVCVPPPGEAAVPVPVIQAATQTALERAREAGVSGKAVTPFVFAAIDTITEGRSIAANIALVTNNAAVGALIARSLSSHQMERGRV
jgi:pseudouridine-5'-phosphate glycosidase